VSVVVACRCCAQDKLSPEDFLSAMKGTLQWQQKSLAALYHVWKQGGAALIASMTEQAPSVGQVWRSVLFVGGGVAGSGREAHTLRHSCGWHSSVHSLHHIRFHH